jgi:uncharacterized NAD-dependent epimerase/dehydratase family protein
VFAHHYTCTIERNIMPIIDFPQKLLHDRPAYHPTAIVYCEKNFGRVDGKTANGLVRYSELYKILSVIDSEKAGLDTGEVLDGIPNNIPVCHDLDSALKLAGEVPEYFVYGVAPVSGMLSENEREIMLRAIGLGMNIVNGLHEFLNDDPEFLAASKKHNVKILDIRKPRPRKDLHVFTGKIHNVSCPRIAVLGTDCAIGKRTTATVLTKALTDCGLKAVMVGTGQTGLIQGARYGIALDSIASNFCAGEVEAEVIRAFENEKPDVIIIEGQSSLSHPAFASSAFILKGSCPNGVILQHAPKRAHRCDFEHMPMPSPASEITLLENFSDTKVIGLTINHEYMSEEEIDDSIIRYEDELEIPATDALTRSPERLVEMVLSAFPELRKNLPIAI